MKNKAGLSDTIRAMVRDRYVEDARRTGKLQFAVRVRDVLHSLDAMGVPKGNTPLVCSALQSRKFTDGNRLKIVDVEGPPSKMSPTVVVKYQFLEDGSNPTAVPHETHEARAKRLTDKLRGLLKKELAEHGGAEAFIQWVRSDDGEGA
jgi:hypothetical protein